MALRCRSVRLGKPIWRRHGKAAALHVHVLESRMAPYARLGVHQPGRLALAPLGRGASCQTVAPARGVESDLLWQLRSAREIATQVARSKCIHVARFTRPLASS